MKKDFKLGGGKSYITPETNAIELMGGPCMDAVSQTGGVQDLIVNDLIGDEGV